MPQVRPENTARSLLNRSSGSLQGRFVGLLLLMSVVSVGSWIVTAQVDAELNGFAKQIDVAGSLRYRLLRLAAPRRAGSAQATAETERLMQAQGRVLDQLILGDPSIALPPCGSPLICTRLREHKRRLPAVVQTDAATDAASGLPAPIVEELTSLDATVHAIATEVQSRVDRVSLTARVTAMSTLLLLGLVGIGVWTVFRRIRLVGAAAGQDSAEELSRLAHGDDEVARLSKVLSSSMRQLQQSSQSERERAGRMDQLQASAKTLAESLDGWLSTDAGQPIALSGLVESVSVSGAWVDQCGAHGELDLVASENIDRARWSEVVAERYQQAITADAPVEFLLDATGGHTAIVPLGLQDQVIGHLGLIANRPIQLTPEQHAALETMAQYLSASLLAQRLLAERRHREAIAASLAVITDLEHSGAEIRRHLRALVSHDVMEIAVLGETGKVDAVWRVDEQGSVARAAPVFLEVPRQPLESTLDPAFPLLKDTQARWVLVVPLSAGDRVEGVVAFGRKRERYRSGEIDAAVAVAPLLATAVARMRLEEQLKLSEQFTALGGFSRMLAHEVRNPLNSMSLHAELVGRKLRKLAISDEQRKALSEHLQLLRAEVDRIEAMVSDFVSLAAGDVAASADAVDLRTLVDAVLELHAPHFEQHDIALHVETGDNPVIVRVHAQRIQQILHNLMKNALDALAGESERSVRVSIHRKTECVEVRVRDSGPGLSDTNVVFSPTYSTKAGGGGMGLAISRQIARLHSGFLGAEKPEQGGAEFVLSLPLAG